jgi:hypothetical protein
LLGVGARLDFAVCRQQPPSMGVELPRKHVGTLQRREGCRIQKGDAQQLRVEYGLEADPATGLRGQSSFDAAIDAAIKGFDLGDDRADAGQALEAGQEFTASVNGRWIQKRITRELCARRQGLRSASSTSPNNLRITGPDSGARPINPGVSLCLDEKRRSRHQPARRRLKL